MKVLVLARYGDLGASSRLRTTQYLPYFAAAGIDVARHSLLDDEYVSELYAGRLSVRATIRGYFERLRWLRRTHEFDAVFVEKESLPWLPAAIELDYFRNVPLWLDYDDAIFHRYDQHSSFVVRRILGEKIDALMRRADLVTVGNGYLGERAARAGSAWVERIPTVVDLERYPREPRVRKPGPIVIGWIGSPSTAGYLKIVGPVLEELRRRHAIRCVAIGARLDQVAGMPFECVAWHEDTEFESLRQLDIGIMPLPDTPWERGKCGYKLIQYMACGLPVVASPVGVNVEIVRDGENGFLASTEQQWLQSLEQLVVDGARRETLGRVGRQRVDEEYCVQVQAPRMIQLLQRLVKRKCAE